MHLGVFPVDFGVFLGPRNRPFFFQVSTGRAVLVQTELRKGSLGDFGRISDRQMAPKSLQELPKTANKAPWSFPRLDFWISQLDSGVLGIQNQSLEFQDWTLNFKTELDLTSRLDFQTGLPDWTFGAGLCTSRLIWTRLQHLKRFWGEIPSVAVGEG